MISQDKIDLIEKYLSYEMGEDEMSAFEAQMSQDTEVKAEFDRRQQAHQALDFLIAENLRSELRAMENAETKVVSLASRSRRNWIYAIAASVLVLIGAFFILLPPAGQTPGELSMAFYETPSFALRSGNLDLPTELNTGIAALQNSNYGEAIQALGNLPENSGYQVQKSFFLGHAYYLQGAYADAERYFADAASIDDLRYQEDAEWYRLLSCVAAGSDCAAAFNVILQASDHSYQARTLELQNELK